MPIPFIRSFGTEKGPNKRKRRPKPKAIPAELVVLGAWREKKNKQPEGMTRRAKPVRRNRAG